MSSSLRIPGGPTFQSGVGPVVDIPSAKDNSTYALSEKLSLQYLTSVTP